VNVPVGFYTEVMGLGASPNVTKIEGNLHADANHEHNNATTTFWRAAEGLSVEPAGGTVQWAVSQAVSLRRMHVRGDLVLHQNRGWASGGWMSDSLVDGKSIPEASSDGFHATTIGRVGRARTGITGQERISQASDPPENPAAHLLILIPQHVIAGFEIAETELRFYFRPRTPLTLLSPPGPPPVLRQSLPTAGCSNEICS
jgi:hypothetical protein